MNITKGQVFRYLFLPEFAPRFKVLMTSGFGYVAFFLAQICVAVGLLPKVHPYLMPVNMGRFGVRHVILEASQYLRFEWKYADRIAVFGLLLLGLAILFAQFCVLGFALFIQVADAAAFNYFVTQKPEFDIALIMLDRVFGIPDLFNSCVAMGTDCSGISALAGEAPPPVAVTPFPFPYHDALHNMLQFYNVGLLVIAALIFSYFIFAVLAETAQSGTPFGKRYNHVWVPLRVVVAIGLLIPVTYGLNASQYVVLYAAKFGSAFATNGWNIFVNSAVTAKDDVLLGGVGGKGGKYSDLVAIPNSPEANVFLEFFTAVATCTAATQLEYQEEKIEIKGWIQNSRNIVSKRILLEKTDFKKALAFSDNSDIIIVFGDYEKVPQKAGGFKENKNKFIPYCGQIKLQITDVNEKNSPGSWSIQRDYYRGLIQAAWFLSKRPLGWPVPKCGAAARNGQFHNIANCLTERHIINPNKPGDAPDPTALDLIMETEVWEKKIAGYIDAALIAQAGANGWVDTLTKLGWGGAAIWYNKIAEMNGMFVSAVFNLPTPQKYPMVMEEVRELRMQADNNVSSEDRYKPFASDEEGVQLATPRDRKIAWVLYATQKIWGDSRSTEQISGNFFLNTINAIFGTEGLFNMQENVAKGIHPLAILSGVGKSLMDSSIRNMAISVVGNAVGIFDKATPATIKSFSKFFMMVATIGLSLGFILFYILPFLPFIYFFFALGGWIKGIFEAMVGAPLWALAHIRIDGNGLPGDAAMGGYFLILEIFLRPIFIVFGLLSGILIFTAQVQILNEIWPLVTSNMTGFDEQPSAKNVLNLAFFRGHVDTFFFTIIYTIIVYIMAMASFKMVDQIPNHILRWMGASVQSFGDQNEDAAAGMVQTMFTHSQQMGGHLKSAGGSAVESAGRMGAGVKDLMIKKP